MEQSPRLREAPGEAAGRAPEPTDRQDHLVLRGVAKRYKGQDRMAVNAVDLTVKRGEFFALLGPSGCGKTTTLNMIAGFVQPTEGSLYLSGARLDRIPAHKRGTAMVFQDYGLMPHLTASENVQYGLRVRKVRKRQRQIKAAELLEMVGLGGFGDRYPGQLSGGQRQRVALARALAIDPEIVLLDEPLSGLDERLRHQVRHELTRILRGSGVTVVLVTHDQAEAFSMCDRVGVMLDGRLEVAATPDELYRSPVNERVGRFVGEGTFVPARVTSLHGKTVTCEATVGDGSTVVVARSSAGTAVQKVGAIGTIQWRPEWLRFSVPREGSMAGVVVDRAFYGSYVDYQVDSRGHLMLVRHLAGDQQHTVGDEVGLVWTDADPIFHAALDTGALA